jgi:hypothetical protein
MRKIATLVLLVVLAAMTAAGCGMVALSEFVTPGDLDQQAVDFVVEAGVADANDYTGYRNLAKVRRLEADVDAAYEKQMQIIEHQAEELGLEYGRLKKVTVKNRKNAEIREETWFGEGGALSSVLALAGVGGLSGFLGIMRKRPGDVSRAEMETALAEAGVDVGERERQMFQIIQGVQKFKDDSRKNGPKQVTLTEAVDLLGDYLDRATDTDTKVEIAALKTT